MEYLYLGLNLATIAYPIAQSFEHRLEYYKNWKYIFPAIIITGAIFIIWDIWFTEMGVWWFSKTYTTGIYIGILPLEEWLFFLTVPFACIFIYEVMNYFVKKDIFGKIAPATAIILSIILAIIAIIYNDRIYTFITFSSLSIYLFILGVFIKPKWLGKFFLAYLVTLIPFLGVNGVLTYMPVVSYDNTENLAVRLFTIPIEDTMYSMLLLLLNINLYEFFKKKF